MNKLAYVLRGIFARVQIIGRAEISHIELTSSTTPSKLNSLSSDVTLNSTPTAGSITYVNDLSKGVYYADGTQWLSLLGSTGGTMVISGDGTAPATTSNLVLTLAPTGVTSGTYTLASVTVDAKGRVTSISSGSAGTVTSVNATGSNGIIVSGAPFTTSGTIALSLGAITPSSVNASGTIVGSNLSGINTGNQTISLTGDVTGSGTGSFAATLANTSVAAGSYTLANITVDAKGRITSAASGSAGTVTSINGSGSNGISVSGGPITTSGSLAVSLNNTAVTPGSYTYASVTVDSTGRVTAASSGAPPTGTVTSVSGTAPIVSSGGTTPAISLANTAVSAGSYTNANITVDAQGRLTSAANGSAGSSGTVTSVSVTPANGVSGTVATATTTPAITLTLGAITPSSVAASGTVTGSNLSGTNTGDQTNISGNAATATTATHIAGGVAGGIPYQSGVGATAITAAGTSGQVLTSGGAGAPTWTTPSAGGSGTVTSVAASVPAFLSVSGSPITVSGTLAISYSGTSLPVANGGTGATTLTGYVTGNGTGAFTASTSIPATNITGTMTVSTGGTGANTLSGYLFGNGTSAVTASSTIPASVLSGTVASGLLSGAYTGVTGVGTLAGLSVSGSCVVQGSAGGLIICRRDTSAQAWQWWAPDATFALYDHSTSSNRLTITSAGLSVTGTIAATGTISGSNFSGSSSGTNTGDGIGGSGTSGYSARFTGSTTIGNGALRDDGSYCAIGAATNASFLLYVAGGVRFDTGVTTTSTSGYTLQGWTTININGMNYKIPLYN